MKKIKCLLLGTAILVACCSAIASRPKYDCAYATQYYYNGVTYVEAGVFGEDFSCLNFPGVCSWYEADPIFHPGVFSPCHMGRYFTANGKNHSRGN